jgi:hypothetical protein
MSADFPADLDAASLIARIRNGLVAPEFVVAVARGFLPMPQDDLVAVLLFLAGGEAGELADMARGSLRELPARIILTAARNPQLSPEQLDGLARVSNDTSILEAVIRNRGTSDETIETLARRVGPGLQEVIVINQERILRRPAILDALLENATLSLDVRRRAMEVREEFFEKRQPGASIVAEPEPAETDEEAVVLSPEQQAELDALLLEAEKLPPEPPAAEALLEGEELTPEKQSAWQRVMKMTVGQKVQCAYKGGLTERSILIRERNKLVCTAVIKSPRLTESEVELFAGMRNIEEEVLRLIGMNRQWMSKYSLASALVRNPRAPIGVVLPLINRLTLKDLKTLSSDKGVSEAVRQSARRLYVVRRNQ